MEEEVFVCQPVEEPVHRGRSKNGEAIEARRKEPEPKPQPSHDPHPAKHDEPTESPTKGEPEPEVEPAEEPKEAYALEAKTLSLSMDQLERLIREVRKPIIDEMKLAQQKRTREHNRRIMADSRKMLVSRFQSCNHMQLPGSVMSGCSCIAWATQSDGKRRGVCQHCGTVFSSERSECASEEIWQSYRMLVRLPTHPSGNINNVFQSA